MKANGYTDLLAELKVLSTIRCGQKINTTDTKISVEYPSTLSGIKRWWHGETRDKNIEKIHKILAMCFNVIDGTLQQKESERNGIMMLRILSALEQAAEGLQRLRTTYESDAHIASHLSVAIENALIYRNLLIQHCSQTRIQSAQRLTLESKPEDD